MPREFKQDVVCKRVVGTRKVIMPPVTKGSAWSWSRLVVMDDGAPEPVLWLLAAEVFPEWDKERQVPVWKDHDPTNEAASNVALADITFKPPKKRSHLGKAGTKEYWKAYREQHKDKLNNYHRARNQQIRTYAKTFMERLERGEEPIEAPLTTALDDIINSAVMLGDEEKKSK